MNDYIVIGKIVGTHALKGEVKIYSSTDFREERYKKGQLLYIEKDGKMVEVKVKSYRNHKQFDLVGFEGYDNINLVEPFVKCKIYIKEEDLQELDEDEYYYHELKECDVYHDNKYVGKVVDIVNYGASDILVVRNEDNQENMIPFVNDFIIDVDIENKRIDINVIEGLINEN
ncbi:MAG TPA: ribosome maturation factor RimM [Haloplasmataceae bacterium]